MAALWHFLYICVSINWQFSYSFSHFLFLIRDVEINHNRDQFKMSAHFLLKKRKQYGHSDSHVYDACIIYTR